MKKIADISGYVYLGKFQKFYLINVDFHICTQATVESAYIQIAQLKTATKMSIFEILAFNDHTKSEF